MEENKLQTIYSQKGISIATFFGGPIAAGYLVRHNFLVLGKDREGLLAMIIGIILTVALIIPFFFLPAEVVDKIPAQLIPLIDSIIIYALVEAVQGKELKKYQEAGLPFRSSWRASGIGFLWGLVLVGVFTIYFFIPTELTSQADAEINQKLEQILENEEKALMFYQLDPDATPRDELLRVVKDEGIRYWNQNLQLIQEIQEYELSESFDVYIKKVFIYTRQRQEIYILMMKSIGEDTDEYDEEIEQRHKSVLVLLEEIKDLAS